ncbi:hypothetical protein PUMCH_004216 [Australozyma saopauloensis]|uniref:3-oxo-5-alpha-steroid 4-dehydrogenase C-terminal domain-containing protein n=1 Tax=Australozyma saopauloensis TaxID=291208 RepID=A0AAX4HDZ5_9ASCO|nr:hypothetical protein PUMCH_004216 [[Candida] saopauloensis]
MSTITVKSRSSTIKGFTEKAGTYSIASLHKKIAEQSRVPGEQIKLSVLDDSGKYQPLDISDDLKSYFKPQELEGDVVIFAKDVGRQIAWKTVFIVEYLGPILIHVLIYAAAYYILGVTQSSTQKTAFYLAVLHFLKREYETLFVHRFSNATMPFFNLFKNSGHYWLLSGVLLSIFIYCHDVTTLDNASPLIKFLFHVNDLPPFINKALVALWAYAEISNFITHKNLAGIRSNDLKAYTIPRGYGFDVVACPNYFFECLAWFAFALLVGNWSAWVFLAVSAGQMYIWALKKNKRLLQTFGDDYKKLRRAKFIPFLH